MLRVEVSGDIVTLTQEGVNHDGKVESGTTVLHADGVERPIFPQAPGFIMVATWKGSECEIVFCLPSPDLDSQGSAAIFI
jgi:hypothetical protein